jgi:tRNA (guanine37-N1)-methyltransferase
VKLEFITIFPEYFQPLRLSLIGKAEQSGVISTHVHDLRDYTHDTHRTVDDTPYGGGAGMVLKPEPIGEALDALLQEAMPFVLILTSPAGRRFTQRDAEELATKERVVFLCGRYEGIDARVAEHYSGNDYVGQIDVREYSIGDYVLNGGEVAALAMTEAITRLLPGVVGNPQSLVEESHGSSGLLEWPVYTKPENWRGHGVPEVLRSGHHAQIEAWRRDGARSRTAAVRPDLLSEDESP